MIWYLDNGNINDPHTLFVLVDMSNSLAFSRLAEQGYDPTQIMALEDECIIVNESDNIIGKSSKFECHNRDGIDKGMIHRAFSVFLFNEKNELLLQKRSTKKITFPGLFTNTCCSHPLFSDLESCGIDGVKRAAKRRLMQELGLDISSPEIFQYITRIYYKAFSDSDWGEHEIDYILIAKLDNPELHPNNNEVSCTRYVSQQELVDWIKQYPRGNLDICI